MHRRRGKHKPETIISKKIAFNKECRHEKFKITLHSLDITERLNQEVCRRIFQTKVWHEQVKPQEYLKGLSLRSVRLAKETQRP
jgi:hypothetical protein